MNVYDHIKSNNRRTVAILAAFPVALFIVIFVSFFLFDDIVRHARTGFNSIFLLSTLSSSLESVIHDTSVLEQYFAGLDPAYQLGRTDQAMQSTLAVFPWVVLGAFMWVVVSYRFGDALILRMAQARRVLSGSSEKNRELFRLVENTAIMAGLPTPELYLIDDNAMNAFAAGRCPDTASVVLTRGLVEKLNKAELQAVIAHELAHIGNRDTRLMQITIEGIGFFIFLGEMFMAGRMAAGRNRMGISLHIVGIAFLAFGYLVAPAIRFALSRRREYQADATAVKITRAPGALAGALSKIATDPRVEAFNGCPLTGNICVVDPTEVGRFSFIRGLYATHPPVEARISALRKMEGRQEGEGRRAVGKVIDFH